MKKMSIVHSFREWERMNLILLKMKLLTILIFTGTMAFSATSYSQKTKINLHLENSTLTEILNSIEQESEFIFIYNQKITELDEKRSISVKNENIEKILNHLLDDIGVNYKIDDRQVFLFKKGTDEKKAPVENREVEAQQQNEVNGKVTDKEKKPMPGVTIVIKGTTKGTITDTDGNYSLPNVPDNATLVFSFVGMATQEIPVSGKAVVNVELAESAIGLDEVVAIGYGTVKKSDLTSSVSKVTSEALKDRPVVSLGEAFQGQLAGVRSQASGGGIPGEDLTIRIRGMNTINGDSNPLYVIDGVPRDNMSDINPSDIESIQVLKDASATSIYGARGGNGVILIVTKQGKGKPKVTFDAYYGLSSAEKKVPIMNGEEYIAWNMYRKNVKYLMQGGSMSDPMSARNRGAQIPESWATMTDFTDWQDATFQTAPIQNYQVSASAGSEIGNVYFSAGYINQDGIIKYTYYNRKNIRLNADLNINKKLVVGVNIGASYSDRDLRDTNGGLSGKGKEAAPHHALLVTPLMRLDQGTRDWGFPVNVGSTYPNPVEQLKYTTDNTKNTKLSSSIWGEYKILDNLKFKSQYSYDYDGNTYEFYQPGNVTYNNGNIPMGNSSAYTTGDWTFQNILTYDEAFGDHKLNLLLGQSMEQQKYFLIYAEATGWPYESITTLNLATTATAASTNRTTYTNASLFARANYNFKEKYFVTASLRYDGSSRFGSNSRWGYFPSLSAGWKLNEESFLKDVSWLSLLKVRGAWGTSGNDRIGDYSYMALLGTNNTSWGDNVVSGVAPSRIANEDLQWEATRTLDFGIDLSAFKNRVQLNFDYYKNKTTDLLFDVPIPYTTGFSSFTTNIGSIENHGWEVDLTSYNVKGKFNWSTSLNLSRNKNKVLDMGDIDQFISSSFDAQFITKVGGPVSQFYCYRTDGVLTESDFDENGNALVPILSGQKEGNMKYVDQNKDGFINTSDLVPYGNNMPDFIYGLTNRFSWKNFDLSILVQGQQGGDVLFMGQRQVDKGNEGVNGYDRWLNSYKPDWEAMYGEGENPIPVDYITEHGIDFSWDGKTPNPVGNNNNNDDRRIYDSSYLRIKNITLGYTLPKNILRNSLISSARFYLSIDNLKTFDNYPGYTPETNSFGNSTTMMGVDYSTYPLSRRCIFGLSVEF